MNDLKNIKLYQSEDGAIRMEVKIQEESIWLTQSAIAELFQTSPQNITMHINNIFEDSELDEKATCKDFLQVRKEGERQIKRSLKHYNLDLILSVGYRVKSKLATQFRIWANQILKDFLLKGFAVNEKVLKQKTKQLEELKRIIELQSDIVSREELTNVETQGLYKVISSYSKALDLLDAYDYQRLEVPDGANEEIRKITYEEAKIAIEKLGIETGTTELFGKEKDESFKGSLNTIYQTFDGEELYPSLEAKVSNLLYFIVKNHSFIDGNKRIGAFIFIWFLDLNKRLFDAKGKRILSEEALVAITLMIAESKPDDKDMIIKVIINLIV